MTKINRMDKIKIRNFPSGKELNVGGLMIKKPTSKWEPLPGDYQTPGVIFISNTSNEWRLNLYKC